MSTNRTVPINPILYPPIAHEDRMIINSTSNDISTIPLTESVNNTSGHTPSITNPSIYLPNIQHLIPNSRPETYYEERTPFAPTQLSNSINADTIPMSVPMSAISPHVSAEIEAAPKESSNTSHHIPSPTRPPSNRINKGIPAIRYSPTSLNVNIQSDVDTISNIAYRISMNQALKDPDPIRVSSANKALVDEITQLIAMNSLEPAPIDTIAPHLRAHIIPSFMFFKEKFRADGEFDKWKGRLVAGGNFVDTSLAGDISASVVNPLTIMTMLSLIPNRAYKILTADIKGAFLIPELDDSKPGELTYIRIDKKLSDIIVGIKPEWSKLRNRDNTFTMKLKKALYGLPVSAMKWMTHLNNTLVKLGFQVSSGDKCCYTRGSGNDLIILGTHVDDILAVAQKPALDNFKSEIQKEYDINIQEGYKHSYIGLDINQNPSSNVISIGQAGYRKDVI